MTNFGDRRNGKFPFVALWITDRGFGRIWESKDPKAWEEERDEASVIDFAYDTDWTGLRNWTAFLAGLPSTLTLTHAVLLHCLGPRVFLREFYLCTHIPRWPGVYRFSNTHIFLLLYPKGDWVISTIFSDVFMTSVHTNHKHDFLLWIRLFLMKLYISIFSTINRQAFLSSPACYTEFSKLYDHLFIPNFFIYELDCVVFRHNF